MGGVKLCAGLIIILLIGGTNLNASESDLTTTEFRQLYDSLLAGKTLVTESEQDGVDVIKVRKFGQAVSAGGNDFQVPIEVVITRSKEGVPVNSITINILDRVNDINGQPIIYEEARSMSVVSTGAQPLDTDEVESVGLFRASKNDKGGFDVHNFGLIPSVVVDGDTNKIAGSNISYSCYPENSMTKCVLTVRDYNLGPYTPLTGYTLKDPIGEDFVEISQEIKE
ncbi:MAG TPA: hypothetical protein VLG45_13060 [Thermodesulfobacteriota bacterium]|nr:hypothetical protein [Thermodesulfobacteriota bacterium]